MVKLSKKGRAALKPLPDELHELVTQNVGLAWYIANRWKRSGLDVEELAQAGMIGLCKAARDYNPERGTFSTYATWWIRAAVSKAAEKLAKHQGLDRFDDAFEDETPDAAEAPDGDLIAAEIRDQIWAEVDRLPAKDRQVVEARYRDGLSQSQASERMRVTRTRIWQREQRALSRLREAMGR
ncbi:MAG: sigma-70 family RNA polymerase sigma factor [Paludisphaera borealis]|uniref:sigma-70 family RNA polymerase sigma factor n=1 Tax=Paludisphaera borealis TaxID=1387353 RepID=UPI00283AD060|nr:sigma-70 family RNA polymerase sigma factor [Paludisphaera borealis]MDR3621564.1 sigma-70 family RNA polymerase sigma factor [Paludisphaera borealis]